MKMRSEPIACLGIAESARLDHVKVPVGSRLAGVTVGRETVFLLIVETEVSAQEYIDAHILFDDQSVPNGRYVGTFSYPTDPIGRRPRTADDERNCIAHVIEVMNADGKPSRTPVSG